MTGPVGWAGGVLPFGEQPRHSVVRDRVVAVDGLERNRSSHQFITRSDWKRSDAPDVDAVAFVLDRARDAAM